MAFESIPYGENGRNAMGIPVAFCNAIAFDLTDAPHTFDEVLVPFAFHLGSKPDDWVFKRFQEACRYATYTPLPKPPRRAYHDYARMGNGWYQLTIDSRSGRVTDVKVVDTSRSAQLDDAACKTFLQWRFQPNTVASVRAQQRSTSATLQA